MDSARKRAEITYSVQRRRLAVVTCAEVGRTPARNALPLTPEAINPPHNDIRWIIVGGFQTNCLKELLYKKTRGNTIFAGGMQNNMEDAMIFGRCKNKSLCKDKMPLFRKNNRAKSKCRRGLSYAHPTGNDDSVLDPSLAKATGRMSRDGPDRSNKGPDRPRCRRRSAPSGRDLFPKPVGVLARLPQHPCSNAAP